MFFLFYPISDDLSVNDNNFDHQHLDPIYEENEDIMDSFSVLSDSVIGRFSFQKDLAIFRCNALHS